MQGVDEVSSCPGLGTARALDKQAARSLACGHWRSPFLGPSSLGSASLLPKDPRVHPASLVSMETVGLTEKPQALQQVGGEPWTPAPIPVLFSLMDEKEGAEPRGQTVPPGLELRPWESNRVHPLRSQPASTRKDPSWAVVCVPSQPCFPVPWAGTARPTEQTSPRPVNTWAMAGPGRRGRVSWPPTCVPLPGTYRKVGRAGLCMLPRRPTCSTASWREPSRDRGRRGHCVYAQAVLCHTWGNQDRDGLLSVWRVFFLSFFRGKITHKIHDLNRLQVHSSAA